MVEFTAGVAFGYQGMADFDVLETLFAIGRRILLLLVTRPGLYRETSRAHANKLGSRQGKETRLDRSWSCLVHVPFIGGSLSLPEAVDQGFPVLLLDSPVAPEQDVGPVRHGRRGDVDRARVHPGDGAA